MDREGKSPTKNQKMRRGFEIENSGVEGVWGGWIGILMSRQGEGNLQSAKKAISQYGRQRRICLDLDS